MNKGSTLATVSGAKVDFRKGDPPNGRVYLLVRIDRLPSRVHNHPSGNPSPSEADLRLTRRLSEAPRILQIQMLDHVIIGQPMNGRQGYFSFKEAGTIG